MKVGNLQRVTVGAGNADQPRSSVVFVCVALRGVRRYCISCE